MNPERVSSIFTCEGAYISRASQPNDRSMNPERVSSIFTCEGAYIRRASQPNDRSMNPEREYLQYLPVKVRISEELHSQTIGL